MTASPIPPEFANEPQTVPIEAGITLARRVMDTRGVTLGSDDLTFIALAVLCGFAATGGLEGPSRRALKRMADAWTEAGDAP